MFLDNSSQGGLNFFYTGRAAADAATNYYGEQSQLEDSNIIDRGFKFGVGRTALFASRKALGKDTGGNFFKAMAPQSVRNWSFGQNKMSGLGKLGVGYLAFGMDDGGDVAKNIGLYAALTAAESPRLRNLTSNFYDRLKKTNPTYKKFDDTLGLSDRFKTTPTSPIKNDWSKGRKKDTRSLYKKTTDRFSRTRRKQVKKAEARTRQRTKHINNYKTSKGFRIHDRMQSTYLNEFYREDMKLKNEEFKNFNKNVKSGKIRTDYIRERATGTVTQNINQSTENMKYANRRINKIKHVAAKGKDVRALGRQRAIAWGGGTKNQISKLAKKVGGRAGYALGAAAIGAAIIAPVIKHSYEVYHRGVDQLRDAQNLDFGTGMTQLSGQALNERQRALEAISNANMSARNYMGSEAMSYH